jgi:DNA-binding PucR family transcriptional regulator
MTASTSGVREQLATFRPLLALSMVMTTSGDEDEILQLATGAVPSLGRCRATGAYLDGAWRQVGPVGEPSGADLVAARIQSLGDKSGEVSVVGYGWSWAFPLVGLRGNAGHILVSRETEPEEYHQFLLTVLFQQAGAALANARLHALERRIIAIHDRLTAAAAAGEGPAGIAGAVNELSGYPVAIEDRYGNLLAWAGPGCPDPYPKVAAARRDRSLEEATRTAGAVRSGDRLIAISQPGHQVEGVIALIDPDGTAGESEQLALEHANTVLALELAHQRALAETELRLRRDLVEELLTGTDSESAAKRARALGYDLSRRHRVLVLTQGRRHVEPEIFFSAVQKATRAVGVGSLVVSRAGTVAVLSDTDHDWEKFRTAVIEQTGRRGSCRVGVGAPCTGLPDFPRSHGQAQLALKLQTTTHAPEQVTAFEDLGVYQLLSEIADTGSVESFLHRWLGSLLEYDASKGGSQLVETLASYLDNGGNYNATAKALILHRSTLRYRLKRIREISGHDLSNPDTQFNLHLATRSWTVMKAMADGHPA